MRILSDVLRLVAGLAALVVITVAPIFLSGGNGLLGLLLGGVGVAALTAGAVSRPPAISSVIWLSLAILVIGLAATVVTEKPAPSMAAVQREVIVWSRAAAIPLVVLTPPLAAIRLVGTTRPSARSVFAVSLITFALGAGTFAAYIILAKLQGLDFLAIVGPLFTGLLAMSIGLFAMAAWRVRKRSSQGP